MQVSIREFQKSDYEACASLQTNVDPEHPVTADEMRQRDQLRRPDRYYRHVVAVETQTGKLVGDATLGHGIFQYNPDVLHLRLFVLPDSQHNGIGTQLSHHFENLWREAGVPRLRIEVNERSLAGLSFVAKFGFKEHHRLFESKLDTLAFDLSAIDDPLKELQSQGIDLTTLGAEIDGDSFVKAYPKVKKAFELVNHCAQDIPTPDPPQPMSLESFLMNTVELPMADLSGVQLAKHGDRYVGVSILSQRPNDPVLQQRLTGVHRDYRRRGIALALKLQGIRYARVIGVQFIRTNNDTVNTGMLAVNKLLGFVPEPSWINFEKSET